MLNVLGHHTDPDYQTELATLNSQIAALTRQVTDGRFHSLEDRHNTHCRLHRLHRRAHALTREAAMQAQRLNRLADAVRTLGDPDLGVVAYVVFGPAALPVETLYEARLIDPDGYTVPGTVRTNLPASRVETVRAWLLTEDGPVYARRMGLSWGPGYRVQVTPF